MNDSHSDHEADNRKIKNINISDKNIINWSEVLFVMLIV